jgi:hypothetical protein
MMPGQKLLPPATFYELVSRLFERGESLVVTQPYKGLLLSEKFKILGIGEDYLALQTNDIRICAALKNEIRLHHATFSFPVAAKLLDRNIWMGQIWLHDFAFTGIAWKQRSGDRVQPKDPTYITLTINDSRKYTVYLDNLSETGLGVVSSRVLSHEIPIQVGEEVTINFRLGGSDIEMILKGTVATISPFGKTLERIGIQILTQVGHVEQLVDFIKSRKDQIREEVYASLMQNMEPYRVEALYF